MMRRFAVAIGVVLVLAGCTPGAPSADDTPAPSVAESEASTSGPTPTPSAVEAAPESVETFTLPTTCSGLIGPDLATEFAAGTIELFNSTNGEGIFAEGGLNTHQQGGNPFGCVYGVANVDLSSFGLTVQSLSNQAHEGVVSILDAGGYTKTVDGDVVTYTRVGAETGQPADELEIHVLRPDSWITGWSPFGGETSRARIAGYLDGVADNLYN